MAVTKATARPLVREVDGGEQYGPLIVSITSRGIEVRPKRARRDRPYSGTATWKTVYIRLVAEQLGELGLIQRKKRTSKRKKASRGVAKTEGEETRPLFGEVDLSGSADG